MLDRDISICNDEALPATHFDLIITSLIIRNTTNAKPNIFASAQVVLQSLTNVISWITEWPV